MGKKNTTKSNKSQAAETKPIFEDAPNIFEGTFDTFDPKHENTVVSLDETSSKKQPSRKGKKAWRKNIDLTTVEETLIDLEKEKLAFGAKISEADDKELFSINTQGDAEAAKAYMSTADKILSKRSAVPAIKGRKAPTVIRPKSKLELKAAKKLQAPASKAKATFKDLWAEDTSASNKSDSKEVPTIDSIAPSLSKKAVVSDIELSHSGASYNPDIKDLEALKAIRKQLLDNTPSKEALDQAKSLVKASTRDMAFSAAEMIETPTEAATEELSKITKKSSIALTKKDRRKKSAKKDFEKTQKAKQENKRLNREINNLSAIKGEVESSLQAQAVKKEAVSKKRKLEQLLPAKKIGPTKVPIKSIAVAAEPSSTLRQIKTSCNLFKDRFESFQERNLIEPTGKMADRKKQKKPEVKIVYKSALEY